MKTDSTCLSIVMQTLTRRPVPTTIQTAARNKPLYKQSITGNLAIENIRIEPEIGDGILFTADIDSIAHRFFVSRETLREIEGTLLANNHDMLASFGRQQFKVKRAISNTLRLGTSHNITFLKTAFFSNTGPG